MLAIIYFVIFAAILGGSFGLMWSNIQSINRMNRPIKTRHPEAPLAGEEVMYVDVSDMNSEQFNNQKEKLEKLFQEQ